MSMVGVTMLAFLAVGGGVAMARTGSGNAQGAQPMAKKTAATAANNAGKSPNSGKKPKPGPSPSASSPAPSPTPSPSAGPDITIPLPGFVPYSGFGDIVVDEAHARIYLTGGQHTRDLVVTDLDGGNLRTIANVAPGAAGMTLSPDGTKLYIAASDSDGITVVDTATYAITWYWTGTSDGTMTCPRDVAFAAEQLWFSWGCDNAPAGIGRVDLQTGAFDLGAIDQTDERITSPPLLATVPSQPTMVIAGETGTNPALLFRFEATSTKLYQRAWRRTDGGSVRQLALTPDGSEVIVPSGSPYYHPVLRTSDLAEVHQYPTGDEYPNAAAIRSDGLVAAGVNAAYDDDVYIFQPDASAPIATFDFGHLPNQDTWAYTLVDGGLAWNGDRIYAITDQLSEPDMVRLRIRTVQ